MDSTQKILADMRDSLRRIEALLRADADEDVSESCPGCGSFDLKDASAMGDQRVVCGECGATLRREPVHG